MKSAQDGSTDGKFNVGYAAITESPDGYNFNQETIEAIPELMAAGCSVVHDLNSKEVGFRSIQLENIRVEGRRGAA